MADQNIRNEAAQNAVLTLLQDWGLSPADAAKALQFAIRRQETFWAEAIDAAEAGVDVDLFVKKYTYNGLPQIEAELFVPAPKRPEDREKLDNWLPALVTGLIAQRRAFADADRKGALIDAPDMDTSEPPRDPVVTFEIGTVIAEALKLLPS